MTSATTRATCCEPIDARHEPGELLYFHDVKDIEPGHPA